MLKTIKEVKDFLKGFPKYNIIYSESSPKTFYLKNKQLKLPISKENLKMEYEILYKKKLKRIGEISNAEN